MDTERIMGPEQLAYYACQLKISGFGLEGQQVLQNTKCLIVGMGGLGCPVALYLAPSGVGMLGLCDADVIDLSNINRQVLYTMDDVGQKKVEIAQHKLARQNPYIQIVCHDERLGETNWQRILSVYDLIIDCTDNFHSKYLLHDACLKLNKPLIQGGVLQRCGQVYYFPFHNDIVPACLRCIWPQSPKLKSQVDCSSSGILSLVVGNVGLQQANVALLELLGKMPRDSSMLLYDWDKLEWQRLELFQRSDCICCNQELREQYTSYLEKDLLELPCMTDWEQKVNWHNGQAIILDVRNVEDQNISVLGQHKVCALSQEGLDNFAEYISQLLLNFGKDTLYLLICYRGMRSLGMAELMRQQGLLAYSLTGGAAALQ